MGLPHENDIEIPDSKEATETNNQAELATTTHDRQGQKLILSCTVQLSMFQLPV